MAWRRAGERAASGLQRLLMWRGVLPLRRGYIPRPARFSQGEKSQFLVRRGASRCCQQEGLQLLPRSGRRIPLPALPIPDARSGGPDPGLGPRSCHGGEGLMGQILHESAALAGEGGRARRGHSGRWLLSSADGDIPHTLLGSPSTTFWDQVVGIFFSSLCFWKPGGCPSEKALSCHSHTMGLVSMGLIQQVPRSRCHGRWESKTKPKRSPSFWLNSPGLLRSR